MECENGVLRRIFLPRKSEVVRGWRKLHNGEIHNLYSSQNIIGAIKSRRMKFAGQCKCGHEFIVTLYVAFWLESQMERDS
jgi:hypothetical protein